MLRLRPKSLILIYLTVSVYTVIEKQCSLRAMGMRRGCYALPSHDAQSEHSQGIPYPQQSDRIDGENGRHVNSSNLHDEDKELFDVKVVALLAQVTAKRS